MATTRERRFQLAFDASLQVRDWPLQQLSRLGVSVERLEGLTLVVVGDGSQEASLRDVSGVVEVSPV